MLVERCPSDAGEPGRGTWSLADEALADLDVARLFERRQLLGQGRVGEFDAVADELELRPLRGREERHDREPGWGVDQFIELWSDHVRPPASRIRRRR